MRSAGPLISKFRKSTFARKSDKTSSMQSYDSLLGSISISDSEGGSAGRTYAGPRVRVRRGRRGKFPGEIAVSRNVTEVIPTWSCFQCAVGVRTDQREVRLVEEDRVVGLGAGGQYRMLPIQQLSRGTYRHPERANKQLGDNLGSWFISDAGMRADV